jgi:hypothetical protein
VDVILNVLLFLPFGLGLGLRGVARRRALLLILATTLTVETLQGCFIVGRDASLSDILTNTLGGGLGLGLASRWRSLILPDGVASRQLAFGGLTAWLLIWSASAALLQPAPPAPEWWAQIAPIGVTSSDFPGKVLTASVNGRQIPDGRIGDPGGLLPNRSVDSARVEVTATAGGPTRGMASIFGIISGRQEEALLVAQVGQDLILRSRRRAADFWLRDPAVRLPRGAGDLGDTLNLLGEVRSASLSIRANRGPRTEISTMWITPSLAWAMILPFEIGLDRLAPPFSWLWITVLLFPLGYWGRRADLLGAAGRPAWWAALAVALPLMLWGAPALAGIAPAPPQDLAAALLALGLGATASTSTVRQGTDRATGRG